MKTSDISNLSIQNAMRLTIKQAQIELVKAQTEATTGQYADIGAEIGSKAAVSIDLNRTILRLESLIKTNSTANARLEASQESMEQMTTAAQTIKDKLTMIQGSSDATTLGATKDAVSDALDIFTSMANSAVVGEYLFSGINTDVKPIKDYQDPASGLQAGFATAFQTYFGFPKTDSVQTAGIAATGAAPSMEDFLTTVVEPMFQDPAWSDPVTGWSSATDETMTTRISQNEVVQTSVSVNSEGMRKFAMSAVVILELVDLNLPEATRGLVIDKAQQYNDDSIAGLIDQRTQLGLSEERVKKANDSLAVQKDIIKNQLNDAVGVDAYEASTRVNNLLALTEASYTLTARIQQLSLVNFL